MRPRTAARREVRPVRALSHAIDVLEALAANGEMGVSEIGREIELSKTAVYNILGTFEVRRMVNRDPVTSRYRLGWRLYELGAELQRHSELAPVARPLLKQLAERTGETVLCAILDRIGVTYVDRVESDHAIRMVAAPGRQSALHATASGMVLLAHQPQAFVDEVLAGELRRFTAQTIVDPGELREELRRVVERGWAECIGEHEPEICSVAVPVRDYSGSVCAAVTVAAPATRMDETARRAATAAALEVARDLSVALGARQDALPAPA